MVNYKEGKIYKIISAQTDKVYIGATTKKLLSQRLAKHRETRNTYIKTGKGDYITSFEILQYDDAKIILLELYEAKSIDDLRAREQHWIDQYKDICVNKCNAKGLDQSKIPKYYQQNKDKLKTRMNCDCGSDFQFCEKARHVKTKKHQAWLNLQKLIPE